MASSSSVRSRLGGDCSNRSRRSARPRLRCRHRRASAGYSRSRRTALGVAGQASIVCAGPPTPTHARLDSSSYALDRRCEPRYARFAPLISSRKRSRIEYRPPSTPRQGAFTTKLGSASCWHSGSPPNDTNPAAILAGTDAPGPRALDPGSFYPNSGHFWRQRPFAQREYAIRLLPYVEPRRRQDDRRAVPAALRPLPKGSGPCARNLTGLCLGPTRPASRDRDRCVPGGP